MDERIFTIWFGGEMRDIRKKSLQSIQTNSGADVTLITESNLNQFIKTESPLHPSFPNLSSIHKSDVVRCYLMHHWGGGYVDLKEVGQSWKPSFSVLKANPKLWGVGYREIGRHGVGRQGLHLTQKWELELRNPSWWTYRFLQLNYRLLIGNCAFIFKPNTPLTEKWFTTLNSRLDALEPLLKRHPAKHPKERGGLSYNGEISQYPVFWSALLGDILAPLALRFTHRLSKDLPRPSFTEYQ